MAVEEGECEGVEVMAARALGLGFDLASDFRVRFAKGYPDPGARLVELDQTDTRDLPIPVPGGPIIRDVPRDIGCDKGDNIRFRSDVLEFNQMSELINQKSSVQGKVPSGYFNAIFELSGAWFNDLKDTKYLAFDGYFICLYNLYLRTSALVLREEVKKAVPSKWDPLLLSRFIQAYGTHIIVEVTVGGRDIVCVRQSPSSPISSAALKIHMEDLGDFLFSDGKSLSPLHRKTREGKNKVPEIFFKILQPNSFQTSSYSETSSKDGLTIICSKRGGDAFSTSHSKWLQTVPNNPDAILFKFVPITSLLTGIPGSGYLSHAINLYLRYKPNLEDLHYFLEFQVPRQWAPLFNELALGPQRRKSSYPAMQFTFWGPKLYVNTSQVFADQKPVVGLRLYLEGRKCNRLAIHVQHLSSFPSMLNPSDSGFSQWHGSEEPDSGYFEPIQWKRYARVCTAAVEHKPEWLDKVSGGAFVVTGAQLVTKGRWPKRVLHLRLHFTHFPNCTIQKSQWDQTPAASNKGSFLTNLSMTFTQRDGPPPPKHEPTLMNSGIYPDGPPVPVQSRKLLKFVDMTELVRGPHDFPGHWLVTAAKLVKEGGKIGLQVQSSLLNYST